MTPTQAKEAFIEGINPPKEAVVHPEHYHRGTYEALKVIEAWQLNFNRGNIIKYVCRAGRKDPSKEIEDLEKALFYLRAELETVRAKERAHK